MTNSDVKGFLELEGISSFGRIYIVAGLLENITIFSLGLAGKDSTVHVAISYAMRNDV